MHYGDPPTPTRVRDVSDGGRHNRAPVSGDRDGRGQLCLCSPRYGGTSTLRAPAGLGGPPGLGNWACVLFASFSDFSGAWFIIYPGPSLRAPLTSPLILSLLHQPSLRSFPYLSTLSSSPKLVCKLVTWDFYHLHNIFSSLLSLLRPTPRSLLWSRLVLPTYTAHPISGPLFFSLYTGPISCILSSPRIHTFSILILW